MSEESRTDTQTNDIATPMSVDELTSRLVTEQKKLRLVQDIASAISSSLELDRLLSLIMEKVRELMMADRATLFLVSDDRRELWSKVMEGGESQEIRLTIGEGIAGWVAVSGEVVNIADAYIDERFQPAVDLRSGYRTKSILCVAMRDSVGEISGVMQLLNKQDGPFMQVDEELLCALSGQAAVSIENAKLYQSVVAKNVALLEAQDKLHARTSELNVLYEIEREMAEALDLDSLLARLLHRVMTVVDATAGSVALVENDGNKNRLRFRTTAGAAARKLQHQIIDLDVGIIGWVVSNRENVIANAPGSDPRHAAVFANKLGHSARNLVCTYLADGDEVLGAIQLLDKIDGDFSDGDMRMLTLIAGQASRAIRLHRSKQEVLDQNRLAGIGQMVAGVLHDLKTPMTIISGYAQLMAQTDAADDREKYVEQILQQFDFLKGMTGEVLAFARGESTVLIRKVYMQRYMAQVGEQLRYAFTGRSVKLDLADSFDGVAFFDQQSFMRLIHNLARNAADAMHGRPGIFKIATRVENGNTMCFDFIDNGPGIPSELEGRIFEAFSSATEGGSGLGLAICKKIVEDHGGTIDYTSAPGEGTTFHVRLPLEPGTKSPS